MAERVGRAGEVASRGGILLRLNHSLQRAACRRSGWEELQTPPPLLSCSSDVNENDVAARPSWGLLS